MMGGIIDSNLYFFKYLFYFGVVWIGAILLYVLSTIQFAFLGNETIGTVIDVYPEAKYSKSSGVPLGYVYCPLIRYSTDSGRYVNFVDKKTCVKDKTKYYRGLKVPVFYEKTSNQARYIDLDDFLLESMLFMLIALPFIFPYLYGVSPQLLFGIKKSLDQFNCFDGPSKK